MNSNLRLIALLVLFASLFPAFNSLAAGNAAVSDLAGDWHGKSHFTGISYAEATQKKVTAQDVACVLHVSADGKITGQIGGAKLTGTVSPTHRGWFWRLLGTRSNFAIEGEIVGAVVPGSETGTHSLQAPFTFDGTRITGCLYATYAVKYPYPFLSIRLNR